MSNAPMPNAPTLVLVHTGEPTPIVTWTPDRPVRCASTAVLGGGLGERAWVANMTVSDGFGHDDDPPAWAAQRAAAAGCAGAGVGLLTAVDVANTVITADGGVEVAATVGVGWPTWAAAPDGAPNPYAGAAGTINLLVVVPVPLSDAALVNAVATAAEAKAQALVESGVPGTGTASDAVCVACPPPVPGIDPEPYGGPRSTWGARVARAVHAAVREGLFLDTDRARAHGWRR